MNELERLRTGVDVIDESLIELLSVRMQIVEQIGKYKKKECLPPLDEKRWKEVVKTRVAKAKKKGMNPRLVKEILSVIHKFAIKVEENV